MKQATRKFVGVAAICRKTECVILTDGTTCPFTNLYDQDGDECEEIEDAFSAVAQHPDGLWMAVFFEEFESSSIH